MTMASPAIRSAIITVLLTLIYIKLAVAQPPSQSCVSNLYPCADYINSTNPPPSCCNPLKEAVTHQLECLCNIYSNKELMKSLNINVTQALALPGYCKIPGNVSACKASANNSSTPSHPPPPAPVAPSETKSKGIRRSIGLTGLSIFLLVGASWMLS